MENLINTLSVVEREVEWTESRFRWFRRRQEVKVQAPIHEIYIDGAPLLSLIDPSMADDPDRMIPVLDWDRPEESSDQLKQLLGGPMPADRNGRTWLLYCQCGDPGCGGYSTRVIFRRTTVVWTDFGWDDLFGSPTQPVEVDRTFVFDRDGYEELLHNLISQFSGEPNRRPEVH